MGEEMRTEGKRGETETETNSKQRTEQSRREQQRNAKCMYTCISNASETQERGRVLVLRVVPELS